MLLYLTAFNNILKEFFGVLRANLEKSLALVVEYKYKR
jgi:hypothetical protein